MIQGIPVDKMAQELKVIADFYDLTLWLIQHTEKFPRHHRYSLGLAIETRLQGVLAMLLRAKYTHDKRVFLEEANLELEILRFQVRLAKDLSPILPPRVDGSRPPAEFTR